MTTNIAIRLLQYLLLTLLFTAQHIANAQQTCETRKEANESLAVRYSLEGKGNARHRMVHLTCTGKDDKVKVSLHNSRTGKVLQSFIDIQAETAYFEAATPDLDKDGFADLVLPTSHGNPNKSFKAWRYDSVADRLQLVLEASATEFARTPSGDILSHEKGGADAWGYVLYKWKMNRLVPTLSIGETVNVPECTYWRNNGYSLRPVRDSTTLAYLKPYCGVGGAGLLDHGEDLLAVRNPDN